MTFLKIIQKSSIKTKSSLVSIDSIFFCFKLFSKPKISLAFFLVLSRIVFTSVAIC